MVKKTLEKVAPQGGKKKWIVIIVALLIIGSGLYWYSQRNIAFEFEDPIPVELDIAPNPDNTQVYSILAQAGITDAMVDAQQNETLVALTIPSGQEKGDVLSFVYGVGVGYSPNAVRVTVHVITTAAIEEYSVLSENVVKYGDGTLTKEAFEALVEKRTLPIRE